MAQPLPTRRRADYTAFHVCSQLKGPGVADELTLTVVGIDFPNEDKSKSNRRMELLLCPPGEPVDLVLEPKNPHDANAISVWSARGVQVGYVNAERAPWIGSRLRAGEVYEAVFQGLDGWAGYIRIRFGGDSPTLPPPPVNPSPPAPAATAAPYWADQSGRVLSRRGWAGMGCVIASPATRTNRGHCELFQKDCELFSAAR